MHPLHTHYQFINISVTEFFELNKDSQTEPNRFKYPPTKSKMEGLDPKFFSGANLDRLLDEDEMEREANGIRELQANENGQRVRRRESPG